MLFRSRYLEVSIDTLVREQEKMRAQMAQAFGVSAFGPLEDQVRRNMEMFERTFAMFAPAFARREGQAQEADKSADKADKADKSNPRPTEGGEIDDLKRQMDEMQKRLDRLGSKEGSDKE